jgi:hypothetical protein
LTTLSDIDALRRQLVFARARTGDVGAALIGRLARLSFWGILLLPFACFGWLLGRQHTIGNDYTQLPAAGAMNLRFYTELGIEPMWFPHQGGGFPIGGLFYGQYFHLPAALSARLPGFWDGEALRWISLRHLLLFALLHAVFYLGYRRAAGLARAESFLLSALSAYNARHLDALRYGIGLEATVYAECAVLLAMLHVCRPRAALLLGVGACTQLLITSGYPAVIPYVLLAALLCVPVLLPVAGTRAAITRGLQATGAAIVGALVAAPHWVTLAEWHAVNFARVAEPRLDWSAAWSMEPAGFVANLAFPWLAEVTSAFGGATLHAVWLVVVTAGLVAHGRRTWPLVLALLFAFLYALGPRTPVHALAFEHVPLLASLRVPGRILVVLPILLFAGRLWLRTLAPDWRPLEGAPRRIGLAAGLVLAACGFASLAVPASPPPELSPAALSDFWTLGPRLLWVGLGLGATGALAWAARSRLAMAALLAATALQTGMLMRHGTWTEQPAPMPTRREFQAASHLPLYGEGPLMASNDLRREREGTATLPYARFLRETGDHAECVLPIYPSDRERRGALLPFYLTDAVVCVESPAEARDRIRRADCLRDPVTRVYAVGAACRDGQGVSGADLALLNARNRIVALTPNLVSLEVDSPREAVLVTPYVDVTPNWSGWIDGKPTPLVPIDGAFLGLRVPAGRHTLSLRYFSQRLVAGYRIAAASALLLGAVLVVRWGRRHTVVAGLLASCLLIAGLLEYRTWERGFCARARRETVVFHRYPELLSQQLDRWRGVNAASR